MPTKVEIDKETAEQIRQGEGPVELVDSHGQTIGVVRRRPTDLEILRAKQRASQGGRTLSWAQVMAMIRQEVAE